MRKPRIKLIGEDAVYHVTSKTTGADFLFGDIEKERLRIMIHKQARFAGIEVFTYCVMSNHFHLLVRVPGEEELSDAALIRRAREFYGDEAPLWKQIDESRKRERRPLKSAARKIGKSHGRTLHFRQGTQAALFTLVQYNAQTRRDALGPAF